MLIPGPAQDGERVAEVLHRPSRAFDLLQPGVGEEGDEPAVRGLERIRCAIGPSQRDPIERIEFAKPDLLLSVLDQNRGNRAAIGRDCERQDARLLGKQDVHARDGLGRRAARESA